MNATFRDVRADIMKKIASGEWEPGILLPSELDLAGTYGCARATVNRAMRELADEGIVERRRKAGTRVRATPLRHARFSIPVVRDEIETQNADYRYALVNRTITDAPDWLRARIALHQDCKVLHLICMHYSDGTPYQYEDRWINLTALPEAEGFDFKTQGPNEWLVATMPYSDVEISFSATSAAMEPAEHLGCLPGDAIFTVERSTWFEGNPLTFVRLYFRPGYRMTTRY